MLSDSLQSLIPAARQQESDLAAAQATITSQSGTIGAQQQQIQSLSDQLKATQAERDALKASKTVPPPTPAPDTAGPTPTEPTLPNINDYAQSAPPVVAYDSTPHATQADLMAQLATAKPGVPFAVRKAVYDVTSSILLNTAGLIVDFSGSTLYARGKVGFLLQIAVSNTDLRNYLIDSDAGSPLPVGQNPKCGVIAHRIMPGVSNIWLSKYTLRSVDNGLMIGAGAHHLYLSQIHVTEECRGDGLWFGGPAEDESLWRGIVRVSDARVDNAQQEHAFRSSTTGCSDVEFSRVYFRNTCGKEVGSVRQGGNFRFMDCVFDGTMGVYLGQYGNPPAGSTANIEFHRCKWTGSLPMVSAASGQNYLEMRQGVSNVLIDGGEFWIDATGIPGYEGVCVVAQPGTTNVTVRNLVRHVKGATGKPYFRDNAGVITDQGGHRTDSVSNTVPAYMSPVPKAA